MEIAIISSDIDRVKSWLQLHEKSIKIMADTDCFENHTDLFTMLNGNILSYVYFGESFCQYRLPELHAVKKAIQYCDENMLKFVLLTPPLSDYGIEKCKAYLEYFISINRNYEVVVNDIGLIHLINELNYKGKMIWGRIMDKSVHEARMTNAEEVKYYSESGYQYMHSLASEADAYKRFLIDNGISRIEYDGNPKTIPENSIFKYDYIYPTEYLTTGRMCLFKVAGQSDKNRFLLSDTCAHLCKNTIEVMTKQVPYIKIDDNSVRIRKMSILRNGNTLFSVHDQLQVYPSMDRLVIDIEILF